MIICVDGDGTRIQLKGRLLESEQKIGKETVEKENPVLSTIPRTVNNSVKISKHRPHSTLITLSTTALPILETSESTTSRFVLRIKVVVRVVVF